MKKALISLIMMFTGCLAFAGGELWENGRKTIDTTGDWSGTWQSYSPSSLTFNTNIAAQLATYNVAIKTNINEFTGTSNTFLNRIWVEGVKLDSTRFGDWDRASNTIDQVQLYRPDGKWLGNYGSNVYNAIIASGTNKGNCTVVIPAGDFSIGAYAGIEISNNVSIVGAGRGVTTIRESLTGTMSLWIDGTNTISSLTWDAVDDFSFYIFHGRLNLIDVELLDQMDIVDATGSLYADNTVFDAIITSTDEAGNFYPSFCQYDKAYVATGITITAQDSMAVINSMKDLHGYNVTNGGTGSLTNLYVGGTNVMGQITTLTAVDVATSNSAAMKGGVSNNFTAKLYENGTNLIDAIAQPTTDSIYATNAVDLLRQTLDIQDPTNGVPYWFACPVERTLKISETFVRCRNTAATGTCSIIMQPRGWAIDNYYTVGANNYFSTSGVAYTTFTSTLSNNYQLGVIFADIQDFTYTNQVQIDFTFRKP